MENELVVFNPASVNEVARIPLTNLLDVESMVNVARKVQQRWASVSFWRRLWLFWKLKLHLKLYHENYIQVIQSETGKVWSDAMVDIISAAADIRHILKNGSRIAKEEKRKLNVRKHPLFSNYRARIKSKNKVVTVITPFNLPLAIPAADIFPAIFKGRAVIWKPSEYTPLTALKLKTAMEKVGFPKDLLQIAVGYGDLGAALCENADSVKFTGSVETGVKVKAICDRRETYCGLEMSGIAPFIVLSDADIELAANAALYSFSNLGQYCKAPRRALIARSVFNEFVDKLLRKVNMLEPGKDYGPFITRAQREKVEAQVEDARQRGAYIATGGQRISDRKKGFWYRPTVILYPTQDMRVMREEVFGPVLVVMPFDDAYEMINFVNKWPQGLNAVIITRNERTFYELADMLDIGNVVGNGNMENWLINGLPQCGRKGATLHTSGLPRHGQTGFDQFDYPLFTDTFRKYPFLYLPCFKNRNPWWLPYNNFTRLALRVFLWTF